ncbi:hypothetical protein [Streptomyces sp. NPDC005302]|uniref:hypothetical protein n=1 Tax=Streptomyces sp. NPDC005302 TaxID=3154675 RepID=UPI0033B8C995
MTGRYASTALALKGTFEEARKPLLELRGDLISAYQVIDLTRRLEDASFAALYAENARGGEARQVVAEVAKALSVDSDEGPGHRWDVVNMRRTVDRAQALADDRDRWQQEAENQAKETELWRTLSQRQDNTAPLRIELAAMERERDHWRSRYEGAQANAEYVRHEYTAPDEVEQMKAAIVRQAQEISLLRGEAP